MTPKLFKATDVCELAQLQPYVLRSWEKEFPGIGVQKASDGQRLYRQSDVDQVLRIKQLVFGEGLTLAGARRRLDESAPVVAPSAAGVTDDEVAEVLDALASDARTRIAHVRQGLRSILTLLSSAPGTRVVVVDDYQLQPPPAVVRPMKPVKARPVAAQRTDARKATSARKPAAIKNAARRKATPAAKRKRASA
jgi:DNA-binding transcriptional MerR regulator